MGKPYRIQVFGKLDCDKCKTLNQRLDKLLEREEWQAFEKAYFDVLTVEGMVAFSEAECINPHRIPALLVTRLNPETGEYEPVVNPRPGAPDEVCGAARLYTYQGLQTDYSEQGRGLISPRMLTAVLAESLPAAATAA
jgi:hypothetical protein